MKCNKCEWTHIDTLPPCSTDPNNPGEIEECDSSDYDSCYLQKGRSGQYTAVYSGCVKKPSDDKECIIEHLGDIDNTEKCFCTRDLCNSGNEPTAVTDSVYEETKTTTTIVIVVVVVLVLLVLIGIGLFFCCKKR